MMYTLAHEDFSDFPLGAFPYDKDHSAMGEYHCYPEKGYKGNFFDPIADWDYKGPSWMVTSAGLDGCKCMESERLLSIREHKANPTLRTGLTTWQDYTLEVRMLAFVDDAPSGILFRYQTSLMHYAFFLVKGGIEMHRVNKCERTVLGMADFQWSTDNYYNLKVEAKGDHFTLSIDDRKLLCIQDDTYKNGAVAFSSCVPASYSALTVTISEQEKERLDAEERNRIFNLGSKRADLPQMELWKKISLEDFGAGRQLRVGHLTGTKELFFVIAQHQRRVYKDRYPFISCLTAVSFDTGRILWQLGTPSDSEDVIFLTTDLPFQVYDIDQDGYDEVICSFDFRLMILDGRNGKVKNEIKTPLNCEDPATVTGLEYGRYAFSRLNTDAIRIVNISGNAHPSDILIKDRYSRIYLYDKDLQPLWKFSKYNTGHFPFNYDFDGDGKDEIFSCYNLVDHDGKLLWSLPITTDHTDEIIVGRFNPDWDETIAIVSGWEGFMLVSKDGKILLKDINGHGQRISIGSYDRTRKGLQICTSTYWGNNGIIYMHDSDGMEIWHREMLSNGNLIAPINWDGSGKDLILLQADPKEGGLMDGEGDRVVPFPDDGHPVLSCEVMDLTGDNREEIIVWDRKEMWIYTQDRAMKATEKGIYDPVKYEVYNASNYRGEYSFPRWK